MDGGDCYQMAGTYLMDSFWESGDRVVTLVHGYPTLRRPPWQKFGHAWVEYELGGVLMARDLSNGRDIEMPVEAYYALGNIESAECRRYTFNDLKKWVTEFKHWGPWEPEPEGVL